MKTIKFQIIALLLLTASCSEYAFDPNNGLSSDCTTFETEIYNDEVSADDISRIAEKFTFGNKKPSITRSNEFYVSTIYDEIGVPAIYVINYANNGGFVLVSATKRHNPILAYSDKGNFDVYGDMPGGLIEWKTRAVAGVQIAREMPEDSIKTYRMMWHSYEQLQKFAVRKPKAALDPFIEESKKKALQIMMDTAYYYSSRYTVTKWMNSDAEYNEEAAMVKDYVYPLYQDEWERFAFKVEGAYNEYQEIPNFIKSEWGQQSGYNQSFPKVNSAGKLAYVGCGVVAAGQVMRYYEYPSYINWSAMPMNYASKTTSDFLYDLAVKSKANFKESGTETNLANTKTALENFGYYVSKSKHSDYETWNSIKYKMPVIMRANPKGDVGHAWVASGGKYSYGHTIISEIYAFTGRTTFECIYSETRNPISDYWFYMNWGWNGSYDGYYYDGNLKLNYSSAELENREDLHIRPNN